MFALGLSQAVSRDLVRTLSDCGLNLRVAMSAEQLLPQVSQTPECLVFLGAQWAVAALELFVCAELDPRKTLVVVIGEVLPESEQSSLLSSPLVADIWEDLNFGALGDRRCRMYLELLQRRLLQAKEAHLLMEMAYQKDRLLAALPDGVMMLTGEGYISDLNDFVIEILGYGRESLIGAHVSQILCSPESADPLFDWCVHPLHSVFATQHDGSLEDTTLWRSDGSELSVNCEFVVMYPGQSPEFLLVFQDLSIRKTEEAELNQLTRYDPVTGLASMSLLRHFLLKAMARALRNDRKLALL